MYGGSERDVSMYGGVGSVISMSVCMVEWGA